MDLNVTTQVWSNPNQRILSGIIKCLKDKV